MAIVTYLLVITLNANTSNAPIKTHRVAEWIRKQEPYIMLVTRDTLQIERHTQTESEKMEKDISGK